MIWLWILKLDWAENISSVVLSTRDILGMDWWCRDLERASLSWAQHGNIFPRQLRHCMYLAPVGYAQRNWFWLHILFFFFFSFLWGTLNIQEFIKGKVFGTSFFIKSLKPVYCDCCPLCKPMWQSQGQIAGWGELMSCMSGRVSSGLRACAWGSRLSWCWRRVMNPHCRRELALWYCLLRTAAGLGLTDTSQLLVYFQLMLLVGYKGS